MNRTKKIIATTMIMIPASYSWAQFSPHSSDPLYNFETRGITISDFSYSYPLGNGLFSEDEVITRATIIRRSSLRSNLDLQQMLRELSRLSSMELLVQLELERRDGDDPETCNELEGITDFFRDIVYEIEFRVGASRMNEWGAMVLNANGDMDFYGNQFYTDNSPTSVDHPYNRSDAINIVSVIHNHPVQGRLSDGINLENRYPSDADWAAANQLVEHGANPDIMTLGVIDPFGEVRIFNYSDRDQYQNLSERQRRNGEKLPDAVPEDADLDTCVTIQSGM